MPPRTVFQKEEIIKAAFNLIAETGIEGLSARKIARRLGSSVMPVYSTFASMDALILDVKKYAESVLDEYTSKKYDSRLTLSVGTGFCLFARDHKNIFRFLMMDASFKKEYAGELLSTAFEKISLDERFTRMSPESIRELIDSLWLIAFGLASMIALGLIEDPDEETLMDRLAKTGTPIVASAIGGNP